MCKKYNRKRKRSQMREVVKCGLMCEMLGIGRGTKKSIKY